jgi:hypothetical protein
MKTLLAVLVSGALFTPVAMAKGGSAARVKPIHVSAKASKTGKETKIKTAKNKKPRKGAKKSEGSGAEI